MTRLFIRVGKSLQPYLGQGNKFNFCSYATVSYRNGWTLKYKSEKADLFTYFQTIVNIMMFNFSILKNRLEIFCW